MSTTEIERLAEDRFSEDVEVDMDGFIVQPEPAWTPHIYSIDDVDDKYMRPKFLAQAERDRLTEQYKTRMANLDREDAERERRYGAAVQTFIFGMLPKNSKGEFTKKNVETGYGKISFTEAKEKWEITKADALAWVKANYPDWDIKDRPDFVKDKWTLEIGVDDARSFAQRTLTETGEVLPWVSIIPARQVFSVKFNSTPATTEATDETDS